MPKDNAKHKDTKNKANKEHQHKPSAGQPVKKSNLAKYGIAIIIVVAIIGAAIFAGLISGQSGSSFDTFKANFNAAPRVAILVTAYNGTVLSGTVGCATAIILQIASSAQNHRNTSTIDFDIINQSSCIETRGLSGTVPKPNYTTTSVQNCLNITQKEPTIYINYSANQNSTIIKPRYLYIAGTSTFLRECGVASQIS